MQQLIVKRDELYGERTEASLKEAIDFLKKEDKGLKFDQTVELAACLGVDPRKPDQALRFSASLPHGTGQDIRVLVFAEDESIKLAEEAGAAFAGGDELVQKVAGGFMDFDLVISTPGMMRQISKLGRVLGPRNLMPNPKFGTVSDNVTEAVKRAKSGQIRIRTDKAGVVHSRVGKLSFKADQLIENINFLVAELKRLKPAASKGIYLSKVVISTTMGPSIVLDKNTL